MDQHERPDAQPMGKVLLFPSASALAGARAASKRGESVTKTSWHRTFDRWSGQGWMVLAWILALGRLQLAVDRREVFGVEDVLAFLVTVLMPIMRGHKIVEAFRTGVHIVRDARGRSRSSRNNPAAVSKSA